MQTTLSNRPNALYGIAYILFSLVILLDAVNFIHATFLIVIGALTLLWHGFSLLNGPEKARVLLDYLQKKNHHQ